jgi:hypothetical protein
MIACGKEYVSLTDRGKLTLKDLGVRIYRFSDEDFSEYELEMDTTIGELQSIMKTAAVYYSFLSNRILDIEDPTSLLSTSIGLAKFKENVGAMEQSFLSTYREMERFSHNTENRLMATEIIVGSGKDLVTEVSEFEAVYKEIRKKVRIEKESAAGVSAIIFLSKRYDGTYPYENLEYYMKITKSYESAAVMASIDKKTDDVSAKFNEIRGIFQNWGYTASEDVELSSAYIAISDLEPKEIKDKLSVLIDAIKSYLEYPLVAATIMATVPVMEANETLNLLSKAYNIIEMNVGSLEKSQIMATAVRLIHGIKKELITGVSADAPVQNTPYHLYYMPSPFLFPFFMPMFMIQGSYYSTFSGIGGVHPAHIHSLGGFSG